MVKHPPDAGVQPVSVAVTQLALNGSLLGWPRLFETFYVFWMAVSIKCGPSAVHFFLSSCDGKRGLSGSWEPAYPAAEACPRWALF